MGVNKTSEAFDSARSEYIEGYEEKNKLIFPTLALVAKEFNVSLPMPVTLPMTINTQTHQLKN